jgi:hypothetical protein
MSSAAATGISDMPTEILERILDLLHDDAAALYSASLVARAWVAAPRHHMFHRTIIKAIDIPFQGKTMLQENVESFLSLSRSRYCTILPAMRCVVLCITSTWQDEVIKVLARAEALSQVVFIKIDNSSPPPSWMARMLPDIHDFTYNTWSAFREDEWRLLASFAHLRALAVYTNCDKAMTFPRDMPRSAFCHITTIQLRLLQTEKLFEWMNSLAGSPLTRVETLDLKIYRALHKGWGPVQALNAFLKRNSETMKHLSLVINYRTGRVPGEELFTTDGSRSFFNMALIESITESVVDRYRPERLDQPPFALPANARYGRGLRVHLIPHFSTGGVPDGLHRALGPRRL